MLLTVALAEATVAQGSFYPHQFRSVLAVVGIALVVSMASGTVRAHDVRHPFAAMVGGLAVVAMASAAAAGGLHEALPTLGLLALLAGAFVVARRAPPGGKEALATAVVVVGLLVAVSGMGGVVLRRQPLALVDEGLWRAASTLTYANATAGFLLLPVALALGRAVRRPQQPAWALASLVLVVGLVATLSRGGVLGLAVVIVTLVLVGGARTVLRRTWAVLAGAGVALAGVVPTMPDRVAARPLLALAALAAGAGVVLLDRRGRRSVLVVLLTIAGVAVVVAVGGFGLGGDVTSARGTAASPARLDGWQAAVEVFRDEPALGAGPGMATYSYVTDGGEALVTRFVHNEYLQLLAELGALGALVLAVGLALTFRRLLRLPTASRPPGWLGVVAGLAGLCVHSGLDFLWHVPVVPMTAAILVALVSDPSPGVGRSGAPGDGAQTPARGSLLAHSETC